MLLPLAGFVVGCVVFTILGLIVIASIPKLRLTITNLFLFVVGAFPGTLTSAYLYSSIFADSANELKTRVAVLESSL